MIPGIRIVPTSSVLLALSFLLPAQAHEPEVMSEDVATEARRFSLAMRTAAAAEQASEDPVERARLVREIAGGLAHENWSLRVACIEILAKARESRVAVDCLVEGAARLRADMWARREREPGFARKADAGGVQFLAVFLTYETVFGRMPVESMRRGYIALIADLPGYEAGLVDRLIPIADAAVIRELARLHGRIEERWGKAREAVAAWKREQPRPVPTGEEPKAWRVFEGKRLDAHRQREQRILDEVKQEREKWRRVLARIPAMEPMPAVSAPLATWQKWFEAGAAALERSRATASDAAERRDDSPRKDALGPDRRRRSSAR